MLEDDFPQFLGKNGMMGLDDDIDDITFIHFRPWLPEGWGGWGIIFTVVG
jgi:hypothetical protein